MCPTANKHTILSLAAKAEVLQMENHISCWHLYVCVCVCECVYSACMREKDGNRWWDKSVINYMAQQRSGLNRISTSHFYFY